MLAGFLFVHDGRTYSCLAAELGGGGTELWWWFTVSQDGNRYAPFKAAERDTRASVQQRIVAYYENHLVHRAMPVHQHWARRQKAGAPGVADPDGTIAAGHRARIARENAERAAAEKAGD